MRLQMLASLRTTPVQPQQIKIGLGGLPGPCQPRAGTLSRHPTVSDLCYQKDNKILVTLSVIRYHNVIITDNV